MRLFTSILFTACGLLSSGMVLAQPNYCTQDTVVGSYVVAAQGTILMTPSGASQAAPVPAATLGIASIDFNGAISSFAYSNIGGQITKGPMPGTIQINADCTGTVDWGGGVTGTLVVLKEGREIHSMMLGAGGMGNPIVSGTWRRISRVPNSIMARQCSPYSLVGIYAYRINGTMLMNVPGAAQPIPAPATHLGIGSLGFDGRTTASGTASQGGQIMKYGVDGSTVLNSDCTFTMTVTISAQGTSMGTAEIWGVALEAGDEFWGIATKDPTGAPISLGTWTRISPMPAATQ